MNSCRPARIDRIEGTFSVPEILGEGVDKKTIKDFAENLGDF